MFYHRKIPIYIYQNLASLRNTLEHLPFCEAEAELTRRIRKSKLDFIKNHESKLTRDLQHGKQYPPNTYVDTDHNLATLTTSSSTKRHKKKKRKPTYKLKRDIIKADKCLDKSVVPQEDMNKAASHTFKQGAHIRSHLCILFRCFICSDT